MTFFAALAAVLAAGYLLEIGKNLPILEDARNGFGG